MRVFLILFFLQSAAVANLDWPALSKQMNSEEFSERMAATKFVKKWTIKHRKEALASFPRKIAEASSPEVRQRFTEILGELYIPESRSLYGFQYLAQRTPSPQGNIRTVLKVELVMGRTAAAVGGLKRGDQITAVDGKPIDPGFDDDELQDFFLKHPAGKPTTFQIVRQEKKRKLILKPREHKLTPEEKRAFKIRFKRWLAKQIEALGISE